MIIVKGARLVDLLKREGVGVGSVFCRKVPIVKGGGVLVDRLGQMCGIIFIFVIVKGVRLMDRLKREGLGGGSVFHIVRGEGGVKVDRLGWL